MTDYTRQKRWREQHPERAKEIILKQEKFRKETGYYTTDEYRERNKESKRKYRQNNKDKIKAYNKTRNLEIRAKRRNELEQILGTKCKICGKEKRIICHRKNGEPHESKDTYKMVLEHPEDWIRLCEFCHKGVHWAMKHLNMSWDDITSKAL